MTAAASRAATAATAAAARRAAQRNGEGAAGRRPTSRPRSRCSSTPCRAPSAPRRRRRPRASARADGGAPPRRARTRPRRRERRRSRRRDSRRPARRGRGRRRRPRRATTASAATPSRVAAMRRDRARRRRLARRPPKGSGEGSGDGAVVAAAAAADRDPRERGPREGESPPTTAKPASDAPRRRAAMAVARSAPSASSRCARRAGGAASRRRCRCRAAVERAVRAEPTRPSAGRGAARGPARRRPPSRCRHRRDRAATARRAYVLPIDSLRRGRRIGRPAVGELRRREDPAAQEAMAGDAGADARAARDQAGRSSSTTARWCWSRPRRTCRRSSCRSRPGARRRRRKALAARRHGGAAGSPAAPFRPCLGQPLQRALVAGVVHQLVPGQRRRLRQQGEAARFAVGIGAASGPSACGLRAAVEQRVDRARRRRPTGCTAAPGRSRR